jgi:NAD(P)-dependent dehydrogenase (short-subunit alcohol dehydrogenase family)
VDVPHDIREIELIKQLKARYIRFGDTQNWRELASAGIRVNALFPGLVDTPLFRNKIDEGADYSFVVRNVPLGRLGKPSEIADAALWLLSPRSSFVTGQAICVDCGAFGRPE